MRRWFNFFFGIWGAIAFFLPFLLLLPFLHLFASRAKWHKYASWLNYLWAKAFFIGSFLPYKVVGKPQLPAGKPCVYCANHTSWLDIVAMGIVVKGDYKFMGKDSLAKIPLFGGMFSKLHIMVNRDSKISSFRAFLQAKEALQNGQSIVIFPEGGIKGQPPYLNEFKDGAFRLAIEAQVPIVPVSLLDTWKIVNKQFETSWHSAKAIIHEPISTEGLTAKEVLVLQNKTYEIIKQDLMQHYPKYAQTPTLPDLTENNVAVVKPKV